MSDTGRQWALYLAALGAVAVIALLAGLAVAALT